MIEDKFVRLQFCKSASNVSDGFTKNINGELYDKHVQSYLKDKNDIKVE